MDGSGASVPWETLIGSGNLQKLLQAMVTRLDKHDNLIASKSTTQHPDNKNEMVVIDASELKGLRERLAVVENTTLQNRLNTGAKEPNSLMSLVGDGQSKFKLGDHVIPLTALKKRVEGVEVGLEANGCATDELNKRLIETTRVLHETLMRELAKMVTREEFKVLEAKHKALDEKVDKMIKDLVERLERMIREVDARVDDLNERVDGCEEKIETMGEGIQANKLAIELHEDRVAQLEEIMPTKADRAELEAAIQELKDEMAKIDIDAIIRMVEQANERIDNMDKRADAIEDDVHDLRETCCGRRRRWRTSSWRSRSSRSVASWRRPRRVSS